MTELEATIDDAAIDKDAMLLGCKTLRRVERGLAENGRMLLQLPNSL
jgi:hypothetical protein